MKTITLCPMRVVGNTTNSRNTLDRHPFVARLLQHSELGGADLKSFAAIIDGDLSIRRRHDLVVDGLEYSKLCFVKDGFAVRYKLLRNGKRQIHPEALQEIEELLKRRKALLADDVLGLERAWTDKSELDPAHSTHMADSGTDAFEEDLRLARMESAGNEIAEIEEALHRIHEGEFGICDGCGDPISLDRLRAIPYTRLCLGCKAAEEAA